MKTKILASISGLLVSLITPLAILVPQVSAAVVTWDGEGADNNWSTAANWSGDTVPVDGDSITFDVSILTSSETVTNDIPDLSLAGITLSGDSGVSNQYSYTIGGQGITLTGALSGNYDNEWGQIRLELDITLGANITLVNMNNFYIDPPGTIDNAGFDILVQGVTEFSQFNLFNLTGNGDVTVESGRLSLAAFPAQNFTGNLFVNGGSASASPTTINMAASVIVSGTGWLQLQEGEYDTPLTLGGTGAECNGVIICSLVAGVGYDTSEIIFSGGLTLSSNVAIITNNNMVVDGVYDDNGFEISLATGSTGTLTLPGEEPVEVEKETITITSDDKSSAYLEIYNNQTVILNGERGAAFVRSGGVLKGNGTLSGPLLVDDGGILAPGLSPGCISSGNLTINGIYQTEIQGTTACTGYDQTDVTGTVDVTGGTLEITLPTDYIPALNDTFVIINNDAADAVTGTFASLAEGASVEVEGVTFQISYVGGDGNDVVLTATAVPAAVTAPDTGIGQLVQSPLATLLAVILSAGALIGFKKFQSEK